MSNDHSNQGSGIWYVNGIASKPIECACMRLAGVASEQLVETCSVVRTHCPALRQVLIPDDLWPELERFARAEPDRAYHVSILLQAIRDGRLHLITSAIHRYLLQGESVRAEVTPNYRNDLQERWWLKDTELDRHRRARGYMGKLTELRFAQWLEQRGWRVTGLEVWGDPVDIEAVRPNGERVVVEVKYIGQEDIAFLAGMDFLEGSGGFYSFSVYDKSDYLLFRAYEAAKQLAPTDSKRIAVLVLPDYPGEFVVPIKRDWIRIDAPKFFSDDPESKFSPKGARPRYLDIHRDVTEALRGLTELWLVSSTNFSFKLEKSLTHAWTN